MSEYRDPKVTPADKKGDGAGKWIAIVIVALVVLALIAWALDWFGDDEVEEVQPPTTVEETQAIEREPVPVE